MNFVGQNTNISPSQLLLLLQQKQTKKKFRNKLFPCRESYKYAFKNQDEQFINTIIIIIAAQAILWNTMLIHGTPWNTMFQSTYTIIIIRSIFDKLEVRCFDQTF